MNISEINFEKQETGLYAPTEPKQLTGLHEHDPDYDKLMGVIENARYGVYHGRSGRPYEILTFNHHNLNRGDVYIKPSTSFSSAYKNPANVLETALLAESNPDASYVYIASFGNHPTGLMDKQDRKHVSRTGRQTKGLGTQEEPYEHLESYADMAQVLMDNGIHPTHFTADEEAARIVYGLMRALPSDTIKGALLNGPEGFSSTASYNRVQFTEDMRSRIRRRTQKDDNTGDLTPVNIKEVKKRLPEIYRGLGKIAHLAPLPLFLFPKDVYLKAHLMRAYSRHNKLDNLADHAVYHDLRAALESHSARIVMQLGIENRLQDVSACVTVGALVMNSLSSEQTASGERSISIVLGEGGHNEHTDNPRGRAAIERHALRAGK